MDIASGSGSDQKQCAVQILTRLEGEQPIISAMVQERRVGEDEKAPWHPDVDIYWQLCA